MSKGESKCISAPHPKNGTKKTKKGFAVGSAITAYTERRWKKMEIEKYKEEIKEGIKRAQEAIEKAQKDPKIGVREFNDLISYSEWCFDNM